jgi:hypothetical protein
MKKFIITEEEKKHIKGLYEQGTPQQADKPVLINKVGTEGLKNITPEMILAAPFKGEYSAYSISGEFNGTEYTWDCHGVTNFGGVRGIVQGDIGSETIENLCGAVKIPVPADAKPKSPTLQFTSENGTQFLIYPTNSGKTSCLNY